MELLKEFGFPRADEVEAILAAKGILSFYPPQEEGLRHALKGENLVLAVPTASGKSLVAYLATIKSVLSGGKALYIVPLRALASEKYEDLKAFEPLGIKVGVSIGDYDSPGLGLEKNDIIIATQERADSLLRHRTDWLRRLTTIVADEVHLINDRKRGPTLEVILARFRQLNPSAQIMALSATISNSAEIAEWLEARHVRSDWRPVKLLCGTVLGDKIYFTDGTERRLGGNDISRVVEDVLEDGGQCLVFLNARRSTESLARQLCPVVERHLTKEDREALDGAASEIGGGGNSGEPTAFGSNVAAMVRSGSVFHHAGLTFYQRRTIEGLFKAKRIKCICATPTLAAGINLPARRVIIRDFKRWDAEEGRNTYIPVMEIKQMLGRAGRPGLDPFGEGVIFTKTEKERQLVEEEYLSGEPEAVHSKLATEWALRVHILSSVSSGFARSIDDIMEFMGSTFFAVQNETAFMNEAVERITDFLVESGLLTQKAQLGPGLAATRFGKMVSDLYIDPLSAIRLREALMVAKERENAGKDDGKEDGKMGGKGPSTFSILCAVCMTPDMEKVSGYLRQSDTQWLEDVRDRCEKELLCHDLAAESEETLFVHLKVASVLNDWIGERPEDQMLEFYSLGPGDVRTIVDSAEWLLYAFERLSSIYHPGMTKDIVKVKRRIMYGVKDELLDLTELRGVGRVRARILFKNGYKDRQALKGATVTDLSRLPAIGKVVATQVMDQVRGGAVKKRQGKGMGKGFDDGPLQGD